MTSPVDSGTRVKIVKFDARNTDPTYPQAPVVWPHHDKNFSVYNRVREFIDVAMFESAYKGSWKGVHDNRVAVILGGEQVYLRIVTLILTQATDDKP